MTTTSLDAQIAALTAQRDAAARPVLEEIAGLLAGFDLPRLETLRAALPASFATAQGVANVASVTVTVRDIVAHDLRRVAADAE